MTPDQWFTDVNDTTKLVVSGIIDAADHVRSSVIDSAVPWTSVSMTPLRHVHQC
jgi:hypothetical protein